VTLRSILRRFGLALASDLARAEKAWFYHNARATACEEDRRKHRSAPTIVTIHEQIDVEPGRPRDVIYVSDYAREPGPKQVMLPRGSDE
jgi:hypothetical protein